MATYYASQAGAGSTNGTSPDNAWPVASITWGTVDNDPANELYLLGAISSKIAVVAVAGCIIRGDFAGQECTIDVADLANSCIEISNKTYTSSAPLIVKNISIQGADDSVNAYGDIFCYNSEYVIFDNVTGDGTTTDNHGIIMNRGRNCTIQNCTFNNYSATGIDILPSGGVLSYNITIDNNTCNNNNKGIQIRCVSSANLTNSRVINNTCSNNGEYGIGLYASATNSCTHVLIDNNICDANGGVTYGTGIEVSASSATATTSNIIITNNTVSNTIGTTDSEGVGIRYDDWVTNSVMYGNICTGDYTGLVIKNDNNYVYGNVAVNSTRAGIRYSSNIGTPSTSGFIYNNTAVNCYMGIETLHPDANGLTIKNNILKNCTYGVVHNTNATSYVEDYNFYDNCTNNYWETTSFDWEDIGGSAGTLGTNSQVIDTLLDSNNIPAIDSPCYHAGKALATCIRDFKGHKFNIPPTIGAYEFTSRSVAQSRTNRE